LAGGTLGILCDAAFYARLRRHNAATPGHARQNSVVPGSGTGAKATPIGKFKPALAKTEPMPPGGELLNRAVAIV
jgi:hypothetical protein